MEKNFLELFTQKNQLANVMATNKVTEEFGLTLTEEEAHQLVEAGREELKKQQRIEFGEGIVSKIIFAFCDSSYISQDNFLDSIMRLQEIFFLFKNESMDLLSDDELLTFMREQFEEICFGDFDYLESTCLDTFVQTVRAGYLGFKRSQGKGECQHDAVQRWDQNLYTEALMNQF
ncbi:MAG: DUF6323 family protein [bacterium]|nr:DUF6323 family protein [bacterium]